VSCGAHARTCTAAHQHVDERARRVCAAGRRAVRRCAMVVGGGSGPCGAIDREVDTERNLRVGTHANRCHWLAKVELKLELAPVQSGQHGSNVGAQQRHSAVARPVSSKGGHVPQHALPAVRELSCGAAPEGERDGPARLLIGTAGCARGGGQERWEETVEGRHEGSALEDGGGEGREQSRAVGADEPAVVRSPTASERATP
jgi:hypothetical protein